MEQEKKTKEKIDMLDKIYRMRQEDIEQESKQDRKELESQLNHIQLEEIEYQIEDKLVEKQKNSNEKEEIIQEIEQLIENYEIQISYYSEKNYKQGFKDGLRLYNQCIKEE